MSTCAFSNGFDSGFEICAAVVVEPSPITLSGLPSGYKVRKRPQIRELAGVGYISVLGAGRLTGEACLRGDLTQQVDGYGHLVRETFRVLVGAIRSGAESLFASERCLDATAVVAPSGYAMFTGEQMASGMAVIQLAVHASILRDGMARGRMGVQVGGEAALTAQENDDDLILAVVAYLTSRIVPY